MDNKYYVFYNYFNCGDNVLTKDFIDKGSAEEFCRKIVGEKYMGKIIKVIYGKRIRN